MKWKPLFAALLGILMLTGCRKGDGTENYTPHNTTIPVQTDAYAEEKDASFTNVTVDQNAKGDKPFAFDSAALKKPEQGIVLALLYEKNNGVQIEQAINYYDADGNVYRYRQPVDVNGDWFTPLNDAWKNGATVVNKMNDTERETLWYLAAHAEEYEALAMNKQKSGVDVAGTYWLYLMKTNNEPVLLATYDDMSLYRDSAEITAFLNWFRYFYHGTFEFGNIYGK